MTRNGSTYNKIYLKELLETLRWDIADLDEWSVHNDDRYNEEIDQLKKIFLKIELDFKK